MPVGKEPTDPFEQAVKAMKLSMQNADRAAYLAGAKRASSLMFSMCSSAAGQHKEWPDPEEVIAFLRQDQSTPLYQTTDNQLEHLALYSLDIQGGLFEDGFFKSRPAFEQPPRQIRPGISEVELAPIAASIHRQMYGAGRGRGKSTPYDAWWYDEKTGYLTHCIARPFEPSDEFDLITFQKHIQGQP